VDEIRDEIEEALADYGEDLTLPERPEPEAEGDDGDPLYDSDRGYFEQLQHYRRYQGRGELVQLRAQNEGLRREVERKDAILIRMADTYTIA